MPAENQEQRYFPASLNEIHAKSSRLHNHFLLDAVE